MLCAGPCQTNLRNLLADLCTDFWGFFIYIERSQKKCSKHCDSFRVVAIVAYVRTVLPHHTMPHHVHITRLMSLLFVWKDRGRHTCLYPSAQPTEEATTPARSGGCDAHPTHTRAMGKLTFRISPVFRVPNTQGMPLSTCFSVSQCRNTTHPTLNEVECACGRARSAIVFADGSCKQPESAL